MKETQKGRRQSLVRELIDLCNERDHAEYRMPFIIKELKTLKISKREIEENEIEDLFEEFSYD